MLEKSRHKQKQQSPNPLVDRELFICLDWQYESQPMNWISIRIVERVRQRWGWTLSCISIDRWPTTDHSPKYRIEDERRCCCDDRLTTGRRHASRYKMTIRPSHSTSVHNYFLKYSFAPQCCHNSPFENGERKHYHIYLRRSSLNGVEYVIVAIALITFPRGGGSLVAALLSSIHRTVCWLTTSREEVGKPSHSLLFIG